MPMTSPMNWRCRIRRFFRQCRQCPFCGKVLARRSAAVCAYDSRRGCRCGPCGGRPGPPRGQYIASISGIPIGRGNWVIEITDDQYTAAASGTTTGILRFFTGARGTGAAHGTVTAGQPVPTSYAATIIYDRKIDDVHIALADGNVKDYAAEPPLPPASRPHPGHRCGSPRRVRSHDVDAQSRRRHRRSGFAGGLQSQGSGVRWPRALRSAQRIQAHGDGQGGTRLCRTGRRLRGVFHADLRLCAGSAGDQIFWSNLRDAEVWLAPIAGTRVLVPFRFSMPTPLGTGLLQATQFVSVAAAVTPTCKDAVALAGAISTAAVAAASPLSTGGRLLTPREFVIVATR